VNGIKRRDEGEGFLLCGSIEVGQVCGDEFDIVQAGA
jgi:hypothetical protein